MTSTYEEFVDDLAPASRAIVEKQVKKILDGKLGNCKKLRTFNNHDSTIILSECVIDHGPGYRVYFTMTNGAVKLLTAGTKKTQHRDINFTRSLLETSML